MRAEIAAGAPPPPQQQQQLLLQQQLVLQSDNDALVKVNEVAKHAARQRVGLAASGEEEEEAEWDLEAELESVSHHEVVSVVVACSPLAALGGRCELRLSCVRQLTPLDGLLLAQGTVDLTGHRVWTCARLLALYLSATAGTQRWASALELGSGTGLVGLTLAAMGCRVTLTDNEPSVLALVERNIALNALGALASCERLDWGSALPVAPERRVELVVASDCLYSEESITPLLRAAAARLCEGGTLLLANTQNRLLVGRERAEALMQAAAREAGLARCFHSVPLADVWALTGGPGAELRALADNLEQDISLLLIS
jgi:predicted nicotinamide N-methyase